MTDANDQRIEAVLSLPDYSHRLVLEMALIQKMSTCAIATALGVSELETEARYTVALAAVEHHRRLQDSALLVWDGRAYSGKARYAGLSVPLVKPPDIGIPALRTLDYIPGRRMEVRSSGAATRALTPAEVERIKRWLTGMVDLVREVLNAILLHAAPPMSAPMPLTDWPPLE